jgi:hypothetical protein
MITGSFFAGIHILPGKPRRSFAHCGSDCSIAKDMRKSAANPSGLCSAEKKGTAGALQKCCAA